jgi:hypothetical protein
MRKLVMASLGVLMIVLVAGCSAGVGPHGAGVAVGAADTHHYLI